MKKKTNCLLISSILGGTGMLVSPVLWASCVASPGSVTCDGPGLANAEYRDNNLTILYTDSAQVATGGTGNPAIFFGSSNSTLTNNGVIGTNGTQTDGILYQAGKNKNLINNGTIGTLGEGSDAVELNELSDSSLTNNGALVTNSNTSHGIHVTGGSRNDTILNAKSITTYGLGSAGIYSQNSNLNTLTNAGDITANGAGSRAIQIDSESTGININNQATGTLYAPQGTGVALTGNSTSTTLNNAGVIDGGVAGIFMADTAGASSILNTGFIVGGGSGNAVVLADQSTVNQFDNKGVIGALEGDAIQVSTTSTIVSGINNEGIIVGRVNAPGSNLSNSGILELLSNQQPSTVNNYLQSSTGTLALQADNTSSYGQLRVGGNASLEGRTFVITRGSTGFANGDELVDVVTASNITGTPSAVLDDSLRFQFVQEQTATSYSLRIVDTQLTTVTNAVTTTSNNPSLAEVGTVLDTVIINNNNNNNNNNNSSSPQTPNCNGALASTVCAITSSFNASQINKNVVQLAPLMDGSMPYIEMNNLRAFGNIVGSRQESVHGQGYTSEFNPEKYLWIRPIGRWDNQSSRGDYAGYNADTRGIAIGADGMVYDRTRLGLALGMSRTDVNDNSSDIRHDARVDSWNMLVYGGFDFTPDTAMTWQTGFGRNNTTGNRYLNIENPADGSTAYRGTAHSDYDSDTFQAGVGLQSTFHPQDDIILRPELRTDYYRVKDKGYKESGADDVGLKVDDNTTEALVVSSKLKAGIKLSEIVDVHGYVGVGYDTMNNRSETTAAFIGSADTPFTYDGMSESPWIAMAGVGVTAKFNDVLDGTVQYDADQRTKFTSQSVSLKLRYAF